MRTSLSFFVSVHTLSPEAHWCIFCPCGYTGAAGGLPCVFFAGTFFTPGQVQVILSGIPAVHPWNVIIKSSAGHRLHQESRFRCSHRNLFHLYPDGFHHPVLEHPVCCMQWSSHWFHWERHLSGAYGTHFDWKTQYFQGIYAYFLLLSSHYIKMHK